jgi:hypothetical protein
VRAGVRLSHNSSTELGFWDFDLGMAFGSLVRAYTPGFWGEILNVSKTVVFGTYSRTVEIDIFPAALLFVLLDLFMHHHNMVGGIGRR